MREKQRYQEKIKNQKQLEEKRLKKAQKKVKTIGGVMVQEQAPKTKKPGPLTEIFERVLSAAPQDKNPFSYENFIVKDLQQEVVTEPDQIPESERPFSYANFVKKCS